MRLHRLRLNAFGPFPGTEAVDFDALSEAGLFLLRGETGAGKTSVLDAVCFALYGTLPGVRAGSEKGVRSHYATEDAIPEVELEFSVRERRFRITRSPEWQRPKKRGTGFTRANASVALAELVDGEYAALSTRLDEVGQQISTVLGMDVHQFTRVAMLPQGEFAAFLRSDDKNREALLKRLFDTRVFDRTTASAAEHRRLTELAAGEKGQIRTALAEDAARHAVERLGAEAVAAALLPPAAGGTRRGGDAGDAGDGGGGEGGETADPAEAVGAVGEAAASAPEPGEGAWFDAVLGLAGEREAAAARAAAEGDAEAQRLTAELGALRTRSGDAMALSAYEARAAELAAGSEAAAERSARLALHRTGLSVRSELDASAVAAERARKAAERLGAAAAALAELPARTLTGEGLDAEAWADLHGRLRAASAASTAPGQAADAAGDSALAAQLELWRAAAAAREEVAAQALKSEERARALRGSSTALQAQLTRSAAAVTQTAAAVTAAQAEAETARLAALALPEEPGAVEAATARVTDAERVLAAAQRAEEARAAEATAAETERGRDAARTAAREAAYALRVRREKAMSAILASGLSDGADCPVCGSTEHPHPATQEGLQEVSTEAIAAADVAVAAAERSHAEALAAHEAARTLLGEHAAAAAGLAPEAARAVLDGARQAAAEAKERAAARERAIEAERAHAQQAREAQLAAAAAAEEHARRSEEAAEAEAAATAAEAEHEGAAAGHADIAARRAAVADLARAVDGAARAHEQFTAARAEAGAAAQRASARLAEAGLSAEEAAAAVLPAAAAEELAAAVRARTAQEAAVLEASTSEPVVRALAAREQGLEVPGEDALAQAQERAAAAAGERDALASAATLAADLRSDLAARRGVIEGLDRELGPLMARAKVAKAIADLTSGNGENRLNMSLSTYVLAARLEAVAEAATLRLDAMSDGRYRLVHVDEKRGNKRSGLGLAVEDAWTGSRRAPETLSGGETFMASLALALGLADVVQEEAGGVDVETLFVDEGFGTLDPETLELVLDGLDQLRRGGRLVGVVSHVAELGQRIGAQVRVDKTRHGSSLRLVGVAGAAPEPEGEAD
ncbi:AAA family ATPase [Galactobacter valiniphilus]|uniref:AAA family ATPase n=1 Tax=Galactobacter valiniphilus TaxID=2676122 RepID=UPI003736E049